MKRDACTHHDAVAADTGLASNTRPLRPAAAAAASVLVAFLCGIPCGCTSSLEDRKPMKESLNQGDALRADEQMQGSADRLLRERTAQTP